MRITKVKVDNKDVIMQRDAKEGFLKLGDDEKKKKVINEFICQKKIKNISLSLTNRILINLDSKATPDQKKLNGILRNIIEDIVSNDTKNIKKLKDATDYKSVSSSDLDQNLIGCLKYIFRKSHDQHISLYVMELRELLKSGEFNNLKSKLPELTSWIKKQIGKLKITANSIEKNKIDLALATDKDNTSKRKTFLNELAALLINKNASDLDHKIADISYKYKINELIEGLKAVPLYYEKEGTTDFKLKLHIDYKVHLQEIHQRKIFGTKDRPNTDNRNCNALYTYHNEVVEYLKRYFPLHKDAKAEDDEKREYLLKIEHVNFVIARKIKNKLIQHLLENGKVIKDQINQTNSINFSLDSRQLQIIKIKESFKRKLADHITFASNHLRNKIAKPISEEFINWFCTIECFKLNNLKKTFSTNEDRLEQLKILKEPAKTIKYTYGYSLCAMEDYLLFLENNSLPEGQAKKAYVQEYTKKYTALKKLLENLQGYQANYNKFYKNDFLNMSEEPKDLFPKVMIFQNNPSDLSIQQYSALYALRNSVFHIQNLKEISQIDSISTQLNDDLNDFPKALIEKLQSNGVLAYYTKDTISKILRDELSLSCDTVAFAPSFKNVLQRARGLNEQWAPEKVKSSEHIEQRTPRNHAQCHLLDVIYYHYFLAYFTKNTNQSFENSITKVKKKNIETEGYKQFLNIPFTDVGAYLANIQRAEIDRDKNQSKSHKEEVKNKEQPYFQRFIQDIFVEGFTNFIQDKLSFIKNQLGDQDINEAYLGQDGLEKAIEDYSPIIKIDQSQFKLDNNKKINTSVAIWYAMISLLDQKHLNHLKGDLLKYRQAKTQFNFQDDILGLDDKYIINLINIYASKADKTGNWEDNPTQHEQLQLLSTFIDFKPEDGIDALRVFEPKNVQSGERTQMYIAGDQLISRAGIDKVRKYQTLSVFKMLTSPESPKILKITPEKCREFYQAEKNIVTEIKKRESAHAAWVKHKNNYKNSDDYQKLIKKEQDFIWLSNQVNLVHIDHLNNLLQDIWSQWISIVYLWERDLYYMALSILNAKNELHTSNIQALLQEDRSKVDFVFSDKLNNNTSNKIFSLWYGNKNPEDYKKIRNSICHYQYFKSDSSDKLNSNTSNKIFSLWYGNKNPEDYKEIRNSICHYHYFKGASKKSLLCYLSGICSLMSYDRKLKNGVVTLFIGLFDKYGIDISFNPLHDNQHQFVIKDIKPKKINHLGSDKIQSDQVHPEYVQMVRALLEYKK